MAAFFVAAIRSGWLVAWHGAVSQVLVLASVFLPVLPFLLLLLRHYHFQAFVGSGKLESEVNLIKQKLQRFMFKVSKM